MMIPRDLLIPCRCKAARRSLPCKREQRLWALILTTCWGKLSLGLPSGEVQECEKAVRYQGVLHPRILHSLAQVLLGPAKIERRRLGTKKRKKPEA